MRVNYLTLTRQALYDLVWSKPMSTLAKDFGISDVALAKRCRAVTVPVPPRGYWAQIAAGQQPPKPPLPRFRITEPDEDATTGTTRTQDVRTPLTPDDPVRVMQRVPVPPVPATDEQKRLTAQLATLPAEVDPPLRDTHPAVQRTAIALKHPLAPTLPLPRNDRSGLIVPLDVSPGLLDRALLLADRLLRAAEAAGWSFIAPPPVERPASDPYSATPQQAPSPPPRFMRGLLRIEGEPITFAIEEGTRKIAREPTHAELAREKREYWFHASRTELEYTGLLRVVRLDPTHWAAPRRKGWSDRGHQRVESKIALILEGFLELALHYRTTRLDAERRERARVQAERLAEEQRQRRAAHAGLAEMLERDAGAWHRARTLRRYVAALRRATAGHTLQAQLGDTPVDFLDWAERYVNQLDPLHTEPRHPDMQRPTSTYYRSDEETLRESLTRLTGIRWSASFKLHAETAAGDDDESKDSDLDEDAEDH